MRAARLLVLTLSMLAPAACQSTTSRDGVDAHQPNEIVEGEIDRRIAELRYLHGQELLTSIERLVAFGDAAAPQLREGVRSDDWLTRATLAYVMGRTKDRRYIPDLRALVSDSVPGVRYESAAALVELGDPAGFGTLVDGLSDNDLRMRYKCLEQLKRATGQDFGYQHDAAPAERSGAVARWKVWLESLHASAL